MKWLKNKKAKLGVMLMTALCAVMTALPVFAEDGGGTANSAVTSAVTTMANDMIATGNAVVPIALGVVGIALVVVFGIRIFKKVVNK